MIFTTNRINTIEEAKLTESVESMKRAGLLCLLTALCRMNYDGKAWGVGAMKEGGKIRRRNCGSSVQQKKSEKKTMAGRIVEAEGIYTYLEGRRFPFE